MTPPVPKRKSKVEIVFSDELKLIRDTKVKQFVIDIFNELCPDYFWTCPCSTSGKYHPQFALGKGGLIRHVRSAIWWGIELSRALETEQYNDEMIAALLLHDLIKNGKGLKSNGRPLESGVTGTHGVTLAALISDDGYDSIMPDWKVRICNGIAGHMGIWTTDKQYRPCNEFAKLIHLADYCASRKVDGLIEVLQNEKTKTI